MKKIFLYWFRDNPNRPLGDDVNWATARFLSRFGSEASVLLVNPIELEDFQKLGSQLKVKPDSKIGKGYIGVE